MKLTAGGAHAAIVVATGATAYDQGLAPLPSQSLTDAR
jgi:hypothetical protein